MVKAPLADKSVSRELELWAFTRATLPLTGQNSRTTDTGHRTYIFIIHGVYQFRPKRMAFRNDYCLSCGTARRSVQTKAFYVIHLFWVPIVPLGFWKRWICTVCNSPTDVNTKTRLPLKWVVLVMLVLAGAVSWIFPLSSSDSVVGSWMFRIGSPVSALLLVAYMLRVPKVLSRKELLKTIQPATETTCPFCGTQLLVLASQCSCPTCGVVRV